jgi:anti-sigma factor RsiW
MDWNCTLTEERLSDFLDGDLLGEQLAAFSAHRQSCPACAGLVAQVTGMLKEMHQLEMVPEPAWLSRRVAVATLGSKVSRQGWDRWFWWVPKIWQPRFAMGIATVAACCIIVVQTGGVTPKKLSRADLNPADMFRAANRGLHLTYARGVKFVNDLRVVYEIQSRLEPGPQQQQTPERPRQQPHSTNPQEKSETHSGHGETARGEVLFAALVDTCGPRRSPR